MSRIVLASITIVLLLFINNNLLSQEEEYEIIYEYVDDTNDYDTIYEEIIYEYDTVYMEETDTVLIYDTIYYYEEEYDTITYFDTIYEEEKLVEKKYKFTTDFYTSFLNGTGNKMYFESVMSNTTFHPKSYNSIGANINLNLSKFQTGIGFSYSTFNQKLEYNLFSYSLDSSEITVPDTLDVYYVVNNNDTTYVYVTEDETISQYDSTLNTSALSQKNKYTYIEIPISVGYNILRKRLSINLKGSAIWGILLNANGNGIKNNDKIITEIDKPEFIKTNISIAVGLEFDYKVNKSLSIIANPYFRNNTKSITDNYKFISEKQSYYGALLGIRFHLK